MRREKRRRVIFVTESAAVDLSPFYSSRRRRLHALDEGRAYCAPVSGLHTREAWLLTCLHCESPACRHALLAWTGPPRAERAFEVRRSVRGLSAPPIAAHPSLSDMNRSMTST
jgi:hypothetical protein